MTERRAHPRILDAELVMLSWEHQGVMLKELANVEDVSAEGMGLIIGGPLAPGTPVKVSYGGDQLLAIVRHHRPFEHGHLVGIEFLDESKHSPLHFEPELLVRLDSQNGFSR